MENVHYCLELLVSRSDDLVQASDHNHSYYRWKRLDYLIYGTFEFLCSLLVEDNHLELHSWVCYKTLVGNKLVPQREQLHLKYCLGQDKGSISFFVKNVSLEMGYSDVETRCGGGLGGVGVGEGGDAFGDTDFKSVIDSSKLGGNCVGIGGGICFDINSEGGESTLLIEGYFCLNSFSEVMDEFLECVDWRRSGVAYTFNKRE